MVYFKKTLLLVFLALIAGVKSSAAPLNGVYTIGGTSPNYSNVVSAVSALNANGVSGPVKFLIRNGTYTGNFQINSITGASAANRITFTSETGNAANVTVQNTSTSSSNNYVLKLNGASFVTFSKITLKNSGSSYCRVLEVKTSSSNDSFVNCIFNAPVKTSSSTNTAVIYATDITGIGNVVASSTIKNGSYGIVYEGTSTTNLAEGAVFIDNTIENTYGYAAYFYYTKDVKFINNSITTNSTNSSFYAVRFYYGDGALEIVGNKISGQKGGYGLYLYYCDGTATDRGLIANNCILVGNGSTTTAYGIRSNYSSYQRFLNNTINARSTSSSSYAGYFYYSSSTYSDNEIYNNVFASVGGGRALYVYNPVYTPECDYNNLYTTGTVLAQRGTPSGTFNDLTSWRGTNLDRNSISYDPAFTSNTDLTPNASNDASWSLNGRAMHDAAVISDINNVARPSLTTGVPDIGAYEFTPIVIPPDAMATPTSSVAGSTQVFTFGEDTVAAIAWASGSAVPSSITVKQYTGTVPPSISSISPTNMFFYTDIAAPTGTYNFNTDIYYKDPWTGTIASESAIRLAKKEGNNPWAAFSPAISFSDIDRNTIRTPALTSFGYFTGIDVANNASAALFSEPNGYFCSGTYPVKVRVANNGNNVINSVKIAWEINGALQTPITYTTAIPVNGETDITLGNVSFGNLPKSFRAWTYLPNNVTDPIEVDDTTTARLGAGLSGVYTVGGTSADYVTIKDAVTDLNTFGICGSVSFDIRNGTYNEQLSIDQIQGANAMNNVTFKSENNNAAAVTIQFSPVSSDSNYVVRLSDASFVTFRDITIENTNSSYGRVLELSGSSSYDSIINCKLTAQTVATTSSYIAPIYAYQLSGSDNVFISNTISGGAYGIYYYGVSTSALTEDAVFISNQILNVYAYSTYFYYTDNLTFRDNTINSNSTYTSSYGIRCYYCDGGIEIVGNSVKGLAGGYGMYLYYNDATSGNKGLIANNEVSIGTGSATSRGIYSYYSKYQRFYNNSINITSTNSAGCAGYFNYSSSSYSNNEVFNNVFSNVGGGLALYFYNANYNNECNYNNLYTTGNTLAQRGSPASTFDDLADWRTTTLDRNSISYDPGFLSPIDLHPDASNPSSWSLNGRGIHLSGNSSDKDSNPRTVALADGVPDIGAYEFFPTSLPPLADAIPATPVAGTVQTFLFGRDTVATIEWQPNSVVPNTIEVRQYSGTKGPQFPSGANFMYFYTDINTANISYYYKGNIYYKDPWKGTIASEANIKTLHKLNGNFWQAYNGILSEADINNNIISAGTLHSTGLFTGIDENTLFSAIITAATNPVICPGGTVLLKANAGTGYAYQWMLNGAPLPGAQGQTCTATAAGDYSVTITNSNNVSATSNAVNVVVVSPPSANITANGPLAYCPGGELTLSANTGAQLTYQWQFNGSNIPGATSDTFKVDNSGDYAVTISNIGCSTTSTVQSITSGPLSVYLGPDTSFCQSQTTPLILNAGYPGADYIWSTGDTTQSISVYSKSGPYYVKVDAGQNCLDWDTIMVNIDPLPSVVGISYVKTGSTFQFIPSGEQNVDRYLWSFGGTYTDTNKSPSYTYTNGMAMDVTLVVFNNCGSDTTHLTLPLNIADEAKDQFKLYPNPANSHVTLAINGKSTLHEVMIINSLGQLLYHQTHDQKRSATIDVTSFVSGHYILQVKTKDGSIISKPLNIVR